MTNSGGLDATYHYYLDGQSLVETRNGSDQVLKQHVWNTTPGGYIDELIQVGLNIDPQNADTGTATENLCERFFWPLHNANFNVMALLNAGGVMVERYEYTPYGGRTVFSHGWMLADFNNDGVVGQGDVDLVLAHWGGTSDADQVAEAGDNGLVGQYELALVLNNYGSALPNDPQVHHPTAGSFRGDPDAGLYGVALNDIGHQGLMHDEEIGKIYNRARILDPRLARFMQRDPWMADLNLPTAGDGYQDGMSLYEYLRSTPISGADPSGKAFYDRDFRDWWRIHEDFFIIGKAFCAKRILDREGGKHRGPPGFPGGWDKYTHCVLTCKISDECGISAGWIAGALKELADLNKESNDSLIEKLIKGVQDSIANAGGIVCSDGISIMGTNFKSCECCCEGYQW